MRCALVRYLFLTSLLVCLLAAAAGCRSKSSPSGDAAAASSALPKLVLRDDTPNLMLTWVDATGDFHVVESIDKVPDDARERVRVVLTTQEAGTSDPVYVADLRTKSGDGSYATSTLARSAWEEIGAAKRKARIDTLAPVASQLAPAEGSAQPSKNESLVVVVYGADWCGACKQAERYLKGKGIKVLEKDVDQSPAVQAELRAKLSKAGMPVTSSIPIIDIGGKLLVGFSQQAVDAALRAAGR